MSQNDTQYFNKDEVSASMNKIGGMFEDISTVYTSTDQQMAAKLTTPDGAMYGAGATKILSAWDENSGTLDDFMNTFENWSAMVSGMANQFTNLQEGTYLVKDADVEKISASAVANRTTALKTAIGSSSYNAAQTDYRNKHNEFKDIDENGIHYQSFKQVENGRIVETKVFEDDNGNLYAEVTHWDNEKGEYVTEYFEGGKIDGFGNYKMETATKIDKSIFDGKYFSTTNREEMANNWKYKYGAEYLEKGDISQMSEEARAAYERLPEEQRKAVSQEMADLKKQLDEDNAVYKYNEETGKLESVTYTGKDGIQYEVVYDSETGEPQYYKIDQNGKRTQVHLDDIDLFYDGISKSITNDPNASANPSSGTGNTGSNPSGNTGSVVVDPGNNSVTYSTTDQENNKADYTMSKDGNNLYIESDGEKYYISYDQDGNRIYRDKDGFRIDNEKAKELDQAYNEMTNNSPYAAALANETTADGKTYSFDENGNVISTQEVDAGQLGDGTLTTTYDKDGKPSNYHFEGEVNGTKVSEDIAPEDIEGYLKGEVTHADGSVSTYNVDVENNTVTITTKTKDGKEISKETRTAEGKTIEEYEYNDPNSDNPTKIVETITDKENNVISKNTKDEITYDENANMVGYKETTADGTETYKYKDPDKDAKNADAYVPVNKEQYDHLKEQQSGDPNSKYTKYEIKDGQYTETECEKNAAGGEKVLSETIKDENNKTVQIKEYQYNEQEKQIGYSIDDKEANTKTYYELNNGKDEREVGRANSDGTYEYLDKSSPDGAFVKVDEDKFNNLIAGEKTDPDNGNTTKYSIQDGNYVETTTNANEPDKVTRHTEYLDENSHTKYEDYTKENGKEVTTTTIKKGDSEEKITKTEENGNVTYSYQGKDDTTSKDVNLDENEYKNIIKGSDNDESTGKTTEYSIENGHYTETEKKDDKVTAVNTKPNGDNKNKPGEMVREERGEDGTTVTSRTCGDTSLTEEQAENLINGETKDGKSVYIDEKGNYSEAKLNANQKPEYIEKQNSSGAKISDTTNTYDNNALKKGVTTEYGSNNQVLTKTTTTYTGEEGKEIKQEEKTEYYLNINNRDELIRTNTKTYSKDGNRVVREESIGKNQLNSDKTSSDPIDRNISYENSTMITEYEDDGKTIKSQTLVKADKSQIIEEYENGKFNKQTTKSSNGQEYTTRELNDKGQWETTHVRQKVGVNGTWGYDKNGDKYTATVPPEYKNLIDWDKDPKLIEDVIDSGKPPVLTNNINQNNNTYTDFLGQEGSKDNNGNIIIFEDGTLIQYCMNDSNNKKYSINIQIKGNQAYKIVGNKLVNVNDEDDWFYLSVLRNPKSRDNDTTSSTTTWEEFKQIRKKYNLTEETERNLGNSSVGASDILKNSYDDFEFPSNSGYTGNKVGTVTNARPFYYDKNGKYKELDKDTLIKEELTQKDVTWTVPYNGKNLAFSPEEINGKIYYKCTDSNGTKYIYDPKTGTIYI